MAPAVFRCLAIHVVVIPDLSAPAMKTMIENSRHYGFTRERFAVHAPTNHRTEFWIAWRVMGGWRWYRNFAGEGGLQFQHRGRCLRPYRLKADMLEQFVEGFFQRPASVIQRFQYIGINDPQAMIRAARFPAYRATPRPAGVRGAARFARSAFSLLAASPRRSRSDSHPCRVSESAA